MKSTNPDLTLAISATRAASEQTYYTIRFLADRELVADAYRAYAYFRWVDDTLDSQTGLSPVPSAEETSRRKAFLNRQKSILENSSRGEPFVAANPHEMMLVELARKDPDEKSGLQCYLRNMMAVMAFDAERRGRTIGQFELSEYTRWLACAVTEAMHYFIGHGCYSPVNDSRYLAVSAAHIAHMLRDTFDDLQAGYFNIPREVLRAGHITPHEVHSDAYRVWVRSRIELARRYFEAGRGYLNQVESRRCRLAGWAYAARFERLLDTIEEEGYYLRPSYDELKKSGMRVSLGILASVAERPRFGMPERITPIRERRLREL